LRYVQENGLKTVCLTDHFWDETVPGASSRYAPQDFAHISAALPLPQAEGVWFLFGCETELDRFLTLGVSKERFSAFDFIVIPITYFHVRGYTLSEDELQNTETRVNARVKRLDAVLSMPLPFHKTSPAD
jgi:histidinol phosphatase-like PHP family hydrolase